MARAVDVFAGAARPRLRLHVPAGIRFTDVALTAAVIGASGGGAVSGGGAGNGCAVAYGGGVAGFGGAGGSGDLAGPGRLAALRDAVAAAGVPVTVSIEGTARSLPRNVDHAAYRILQESLTNVLRHAGPDASATVQFTYGATALTLEVTDDGVAAAPPGGTAAARAIRQHPDGNGLTGMSERAAAIGGELTAGPRPEGGFAVSARLPVPPWSPEGRGDR